MSTIKQRINISVSEEVGYALERLAKRDKSPVATKAAAPLALALEIEEDRYFEEIAKKRDVKGARWTSHKSAWA